MIQHQTGCQQVCEQRGQIKRSGVLRVFHIIPLRNAIPNDNGDLCVLLGQQTRTYLGWQERTTIRSPELGEAMEHRGDRYLECLSETWQDAVPP